MSKQEVHFFSELKHAIAAGCKSTAVMKDFQALPLAWKKHLSSFGLFNTRNLYGAELLWDQVNLKFSTNGNWHRISCRQWNFLHHLARVAYMKTKLLGLFSLKDLDSLQKGVGRMQVRALNLIDLIESIGTKMKQSGLVTILAETMIIPNYVMQSYISWNEIDKYTLDLKEITIISMLSSAQSNYYIMERYWLFYLLALLAEIVGTITGFGSSILFVPIASMFFDFHLVLAITAAFHVFSNLSKIYLFRNGINRYIVLKMGVPAILMVILGALLAGQLPQATLELSMAILVGVLAVYMALNSKKTIEPSGRNLSTGGAISGFFAGLVGTGGAIRGLALTAFNMEKNTFVATSALIDLGVDGSRAFIYYLNGFFVSSMWITLIPLVLISIVGSWTGKLLLKHIAQHRFRTLVLWAIIVTSLFQMVRNLIGFF